MTCQELVRRLSDYIDGTLAPEARAEVEAHLADCDDCHLVLDTTQCTILLYRAAESPSLDAAAPRGSPPAPRESLPRGRLPIGLRSKPFPRSPEGLRVYDSPVHKGVAVNRVMSCALVVLLTALACAPRSDDAAARAAAEGVVAEYVRADECGRRRGDDRALHRRRGLDPGERARPVRARSHRRDVPFAVRGGAVRVHRHRDRGPRPGSEGGRPRRVDDDVHSEGRRQGTPLRRRVGGPVSAGRGPVAVRVADGQQQPAGARPDGRRRRRAGARPAGKGLGGRLREGRHEGPRGRSSPRTGWPRSRASPSPARSSSPRCAPEPRASRSRMGPRRRRSSSAIPPSSVEW